MSLIERSLALLGLVAPSALLAPAAVHDEVRDARLAGAVVAARALLRQRQAEQHERFSEREAACAAERLAREQIGAVEVAVEAERTAREADEAYRRAAFERGELAADPLVAARAEAASKALNEAHRSAHAAEAALPTLIARAEDAQIAARTASERIGSAAWDVLVAEIAVRTAHGHACAAALSECYVQLAALEELRRKHRVYGIEADTLPEGLVPFVDTHVEDSILYARMRPFAEFVKRLRDDPEAQLD